jgi:AcrR family transcriptional regulator
MPVPYISVVSRPYHSPHRKAQARATRVEILAAGRRLFGEHGYAATSVQDVARAAGVSTRTVYLAFPTKRALLSGIWEAAVGGADDQLPTAKRDWVIDVYAEPEPARQLELVARNSLSVMQRTADVAETIRAAAAADPEIGEMWRKMQSDLHDHDERVARALRDQGALHRRLTLPEAADVLWTLTHPSVYRLLVVERGWTPERYRGWLADTLRQQLLDGAPGDR